MRHATSTLPAIALLISACGLDLGWGDPCDPTNPSNPHLSVEQQNACDQCGQVDCSDVSETGADEANEITDLTCSSDLDFDYTAKYCAVGRWTAQDMGEGVGQVENIDASECRTLSVNTYPCYRSWWDPNTPKAHSPSQCVLCDALEAGIYPVGPGGPGWGELGPYPPREVTFGVCSEEQYGAPGYTGTYTFGSGWLPSDLDASLEEIQAEAASVDWSEPLGCPMEFGTPTPTPFACDVVQVLDEGIPWSHEVATNWTCRCESDADCQPGAVCEAGWIIEGGLPKPTLCTWDDGMGTSNGVAPEGPVVYGASSWADIVRVDGHDVTLYVDDSLDLRTGLRAFIERALNDDQRFGLAGEVTYCGVHALCSHLGLQVGDVVEITQDQYDALVAGRRIDIDVVDAARRRTPWSVALAAR